MPMTTSSITIARTAQHFSVLHAALCIDHRTIVRKRRCHGTKFCGVELQQQQRAVATNGGMDGDWHEGQRPEARGPVVLRAAAAAVAGGNGDGGGGGGDIGGGEGDGGRLRPHLRRNWCRHPNRHRYQRHRRRRTHRQQLWPAPQRRQQQDICYCTCDLVMIMVMFQLG